MGQALKGSVFLALYFFLFDGWGEEIDRRGWREREIMIYGLRGVPNV